MLASRRVRPARCCRPLLPAKFRQQEQAASPLQGSKSRILGESTELEAGQRVLLQWVAAVSSA